MGSNIETKMVISAEDKASSQIKSVAEQVKSVGEQTVASAKDMANSFGGVSQAINLAATALASFVAYKIADVTKDVALTAARYQTLGVVMEVVGKNTGYTAAEMNGLAAALQKTGISMTESRSNIAKMAQAHLDLARSTELARIAQDAAVIGGMNSSEAFAHMIYGIQSGQVEVLRTIGINVNFENSYKTLAEQLGKSKEALTEAEKATARMNAVLAAGPAIAGAYEAAMGTAGKMITSMTRYVDDLKVLLGELFTPSLTLIVDQLTAALKDANGTLKDSKKIVEDWGYTFTLKVIEIEAEVRRLAMLLDKVGGSMTAFMAYAAIPVAVVTGDASASAKFAAMNEEFKKRYEINDKQMIELGALYEKTMAAHSPAALAAKATEASDKETLQRLEKMFNTTNASIEATQAASDKAAAERALNESKNPILIKMRQLEEYTKKLKETDEYKNLVLAKGEDAGDKWIKDTISANTKEDKSGLKDSEKAAQAYKDAMAGVIDEYNLMTLSAEDYKRAKIWEAYEKESLVLGKNNAYLQAARDLKLQAIQDAENQKASEYKMSMMGDPFSGAPEYFQKVADEKLALQTDLTAKINQLTLSEHDFKIWSLDQEVEKMRLVAGEDMALVARVAEYQMDKIKEIQNSENAWLGFSKHLAKEMEKSFSDLFFNVLTGKFKTFEDYLTGIMNAIARMVSDYMARIARDIMFGNNEKQVGGIVGSVMTYLGVGSSGGLGVSSDFASGGYMHSGGIVGQDYSAEVFPASTFVGAPRLHSGLASDEFPAILQKGETVIPKGGTTTPNVTVNVVNNSGTKVSGQPKVSFDAQGIVVSLWLDALDRNVGGLRSAIGG